MTDDGQTLDRAREAKHTLDDPAIQRAIEYCEQNYVYAWRKGKTTAEREQAHARLMALEDVVLHIRKEFERGEVLRVRDEKQNP